MDGYLADKNNNLDWLYQTGELGETDYESFYKNMDITIMGKKTFQEIEKVDNIHSLYPTTQNYVFTHEEHLSVSGFIPMNCDVVEFVRQMDRNKNIWVIGGNTILAPLLDNDMVDNMIIQIAPVLLGEGIPLFSQKEVLKRFCLKEVKKYGQFAELIYSKI
jgi:dihydrofolate reductase